MRSILTSLYLYNGVVLSAMVSKLLFFSSAKRSMQCYFLVSFYAHCLDPLSALLPSDMLSDIINCYECNSFSRFSLLFPLEEQ